jgi:hypothetical protein
MSSGLRRSAFTAKATQLYADLLVLDLRSMADQEAILDSLTKLPSAYFSLCHRTPSLLFGECNESPY